jgi:enolase-phosphatase E1
MQFTGRGILLDIEGTTSSISFVYDVMFPFVRRELDRYLRAQWSDNDLKAACDQIAKDLGQETLQRWTGESATPEAQQQLVRDEVLRLMDGDVKSTGLKQLQGLIWQQGFDSGELHAHVYDDVVPALQAWHAAGKDVRIYSSGSIQAQRLFFGHTTHGDLLPLLRGHYDTTTGGKREATSYLKIAVEFGLPPGEILFLSDVVAELDAARSAGMSTALVKRPGNAPVADHSPAHVEVTSFNEIVI